MSEVKLFRLSGSALAIDMRTGHNATLRPGLVVLSEDAHTHAIEALAAECERLRELFKESEQHLHYWQRQAAANGRSTKKMEIERDAALAELAALKGGRGAVGEWPDADIVAAWKWCEENGGTPAEFLSHSLLVKRSRVLGRPLTWREAIELTHATTDMPDEQRDKLLAMDDAPPAQASAWVPEGLPAALFNALESYKKCAELFEGERDKGIHKQQCELIRQHAAAMLAAPTPGASDGKGGE